MKGQLTMKWLAHLMALVVILSAPLARAESPLAFRAGTYVWDPGATAGRFVPFEPGHQLVVGDRFFYRADLPDDTDALILTFDPRATWISGAGWCHGGDDWATLQTCDPGLPAVVEFYVEVRAAGSLHATATYRGNTLGIDLPAALCSRCLYLPFVAQ